MSKISQSERKRNLKANQNKFDQTMKDHEAARAERNEKTARLRELRLAKQTEAANAKSD